jgi:hypothetical protein
MKYFFTLFLITVLFFSIFNAKQFPEANPSDQASLPYLVVPNAYSSVPAGSSFLGPFATSPRTYQLLIHENQLTTLAGQYIDAITWRIPTNATAPWPVSDVTFTSFDIYLSESVPPANRSLVFAENVAGPQTQVRAGTLTISRDSYPSGGNPNEFGMDITFGSSYLYTGGHLLIEIRHTGFTGSIRTLEAAASTSSGYGTNFSGCWQNGYTATSGLQGNFAVTRLSSTIVGINNITEYPDEFKLNQNYPNPFNPSTIISYSLKENSNVTLTVFDLLGREVALLVNESQNAGVYNYEFRMTNNELTSGTYFYKLETEKFSDVKKMILLR